MKTVACIILLAGGVAVAAPDTAGGEDKTKPSHLAPGQPRRRFFPAERS